MKTWLRLSLAGLLSAGSLGSPMTTAAVENAYLYLKIYHHAPEELADRPLGYVSANPDKPLPRLPRSGWYVRVLGALPQFTSAKLSKVLIQRGIRGVDLSAQSGVSDADMPEIAKIEGLRFLSLAGTRVTGQGLASLAGLRDLESLRLSSAINDEGLAHIAQFSQLRELSLRGAAISNAGLTALSALRKLESLDLSDTPITDDGLRALEGLPLRVLILGPKISDQGLRHLRSIKSLRQLDLSQTQVTDEGLQALSSFRSLHTLFASRHITSKGLLELVELKSLRRLDLTGSDVTDTTLGVLSILNHLEELALSDTAISDGGLRRLNQLPRLRVLEISGTGITPDGWEELRPLRSLEILSLSWREGLRRSALRPIMALPKLRLLIANGRPVPKRQLDQIKDTILAPSPKPEGSTGESAPAMAALPGMRRLYLAEATEDDTEVSTREIRFSVGSSVL